MKSKTLIKEFLEFMKERERIRLAKEAGKPWPWTKDEIMQTYKFTNVHRRHDRTTRELVKEFYDKFTIYKPEVILFNCAKFRWFGTTQFARRVGWTKKLDKKAVDHILKQATQMKRKEGLKIFTGAYIVTSGGVSMPKEKYVVQRVLAPFAKEAKNVSDVMLATRSWEAGYHELRKSSGFGGNGFMAKEVLQDALLCAPFKKMKDKDSWTPVGPGARRGLRSVYGIKDNINEDRAIELCVGLWEEVKGPWAKWAGNTADAADDLSAHDVQFQLCEFYKFMKVKTGRGRPRSIYRHIDPPWKEN